MTRAYSDIRAFGLDAEGRLVLDLACISCGYNLKSLAREGVCPECGTAVERSLQGDRLRYSPREWIATVMRGLKLVVRSAQIMLVGILLLFVLVIVRDATNIGATSPYEPWYLTFPLIAVFLFSGLTVLVGLWVFATPEPQLDSHAAAWRVDVRGLIRVFLVMFGGALNCEIAFDFRGTAEYALELVLILTGHGLLLSAAKYAEWLCKRVPDGGTAKAARTVYRMTLFSLFLILVDLLVPLWKNRRAGELVACGNLLAVVATLYFLKVLSSAFRALDIVIPPARERGHALRENGHPPSTRH